MCCCTCLNHHKSSGENRCSSSRRAQQTRRLKSPHLLALRHQLKKPPKSRHPRHLSTPYGSNTTPLRTAKSAAPVRMQTSINAVSEPAGSAGTAAKAAQARRLRKAFKHSQKSSTHRNNRYHPFSPRWLTGHRSSSQSPRSPTANGTLSCEEHGEVGASRTSPRGHRTIGPCSSRGRTGSVSAAGRRLPAYRCATLIFPTNVPLLRVRISAVFLRRRHIFLSRGS